MVRSSLWPCSHDKPSWEPYRLGLLAPYKGIRNLESGNFIWCRWNTESWALESGIQLKESRIPLTIRIQNPSSTDKESGIQYQESGTHGVESRIRDCLGAFVHTWNTTVKHRLKVTSVIRSPRYSGHSSWPPGKNRHTFSCKKPLLIRPIFLAHWWPY